MKSCNLIPDFIFELWHTFQISYCTIHVFLKWRIMFKLITFLFRRHTSLTQITFWSILSSRKETLNWWIVSTNISIRSFFYGWLHIIIVYPCHRFLSPMGTCSCVGSVICLILVTMSSLMRTSTHCISRLSKSWKLWVHSRKLWSISLTRSLNWSVSHFLTWHHLVIGYKIICGGHCLCPYTVLPECIWSGTL